MLCVIFIMIGIKKTETNSIDYERIVVAEGDTLWSYSKQYADNVPAHRWIEEIVKMNNLSSAHIRAGEEILIPEMKKKSFLNHPTQIAGDEK